MTVDLRNRLIPLAIASAMLLGSSIAESRVVRITIDSRTPLSNGEFFGTVGPYELVRGTASGELDPNDRRNAVITDITLRPRTPPARSSTVASLRSLQAEHEQGVRDHDFLRANMKYRT
jgi:hypothetical protein